MLGKRKVHIKASEEGEDENPVAQVDIIQIDKIKSSGSGSARQVIDKTKPTED